MTICFGDVEEALRSGMVIDDWLIVSTSPNPEIGNLSVREAEAEAEFLVAAENQTTK